MASRRKQPPKAGKHGTCWVRDGIAYKTLTAALAGTDPLPRQKIKPGTLVPWDAVVRQAAPPTVPAKQQKADFVVDTSWGETLHGTPGDWLLGSGDDQWIVGPAEFAATYVKSGRGSFVKTGWALMRRMPRHFVVFSREGRVEGAAGDVLMQGPLGDRWRIAAEKYPSKGYVPLHELPADAPPSPVEPPVLLDWERQSAGTYRAGRQRITREGARWKRAGRLYERLGDAMLGLRR